MSEQIKNIAELYDHMKAVAECAGFKSLTQAIVAGERGIELDALLKKAEEAREGERVRIVWEADDSYGPDPEMYSDTVEEAMLKSIDNYEQRRLRRG